MVTDEKQDSAKTPVKQGRRKAGGKPHRNPIKLGLPRLLTSPAKI